MRIYKNFLIVLIIAFLMAGIYVAFSRQKNPVGRLDQALPSSTQVPAADLVESTKSAKVTINYDCQKGKTAYEILKASHTLEVKESDLGPMVLGIDGVKAGEKEFWSFNVDGKEAAVGAHNYKCINNEKIQWKIEGY